MKTAIITGGGRGLGRGISLGLAADGFTIAVCYHKRARPAEEVIKDITLAGGTAYAFQVDVSVKDQVQIVMKRILTQFGRVDVLVNNAGTASKASSESLSEAEWDRVLDVNLKGAFLCSQAILQSMYSQGRGRIINITSIAGQTGGGIGPHYAASKAGLIGLTRYLAREVGPHGITVNAVAPSGIPTQLLKDLELEVSGERPVGRVGTPEDVAAAVCYLASDAASYVTGQILSVNGGTFIG